jgi:dienelactone hydrolase
LAYFALEDLPAALVNIPLEYFATAITWLQAQPGVQRDQLAVVGGSKGGELALLLGATFPQINAVVAYTPSNVLWNGIDNTPSDTPKPSWTYGGEALPSMPAVEPALGQAINAQEVVVLTPLFLPRLADPALVEQSTIAVEKIKGPVLLISGQDDQMWPSAQMAALVMERLTHHRHPYPDQHLSYADVGHSIGIPYFPTTVTRSRHSLIGKVYAMGGKAQASAAARADSWARVLAFLGEHLGS